jgi:hypothetical protein
MSNYVRAKCAKESCTRRSELRNKVVATTQLGACIIYLCNRCYAEFCAEEAKRAEERR